MSLEHYKSVMLPAIEKKLKELIHITDLPVYEELIEMLVFHMGWEESTAAIPVSGKRVRPLLVLLSASAMGGDWNSAVPASAAVELIHNFSLIHDDIQDNSDLRRGRPTIWKIWGVPQAINTGDTMFALAQKAVLELKDTISLNKAIQASQILQEACIHLTQGQYLDMMYESRDDMDVDSYWTMIEGKTAALLATSTELGALCGNNKTGSQKFMRDFGYYLGLAFQTQDDFLGVWGDAMVTGKSAESDLNSGKKTLPILFGLQQGGEFSKLWNNSGTSTKEIPSLVVLLEKEGAKEYTEQKTTELTNLALKALDNANPTIEAGEALERLAKTLLKRKE